MIAAGYLPLDELSLFGELDAPWIERVIDTAEAARGEPWRQLLERLEHAIAEVSPGRVCAIARVLHRSDGRRSERARLARRVRSLVLGAAAIEPGEREARLLTAAAALEVEPADVAELLWADLALERAVALPATRPAWRALAETANLERLQRAARRAHRAVLRVWGEVDEVARTVARHGLIASIARPGSGPAVVELAGPLSLLHDTLGYGRALAALVPWLADHDRFELELHLPSTEDAPSGAAPEPLRILPPVLLPQRPPPRRCGPLPSDALAAALRAAGCAVEHEPPPLEHGDRLLFPDLAVDRDGTRWWLEVLGFSTAAVLADRLAAYAAAGHAHALLCIDAARCGPAGPLTLAPLVPRVRSRIIAYRESIDPAAVLAAMVVP